jgi:hypothetical protein
MGAKEDYDSQHAVADVIPQNDEAQDPTTSMVFAIYIDIAHS